MRISFDLDDTLFVAEADGFLLEPELKFPLNRIYKERLRAGTVRLMQQLRELGCEIWVYTTSFRSPFYIRSLFRCYGIRIDEIVNGARHEKEVQADHAEPMPSKYPAHYRIDLHVDDDRSVLANGQYYGFRVFLIGPPDENWADKIIGTVKKIMQKIIGISEIGKGA